MKKARYVYSAWLGYEGKEVTDVENTLASLLESSLDRENIRDSTIHIISKISYKQIGEALKYLDRISFEYEWQKYSFIERYFGIPAQSILNEQARADFLARYTSS